MSLQFILGRAGSGKTHTCWEEIRWELQQEEASPPLILLVPEQATFQDELALASTPGLGGIMRAQVLSFQRLAWRVLQEVGGSARVLLDDLGKRMALRGLLEQHKDKLQLFYRAADQPGFIDSLADALSELKAYCLTPATIKGVLDSGLLVAHGLLGVKLQDLYLLYQKLEEYLASQYLDPDDYLLLLAERLEKSPTVQDAKIWLDGFSGFTPQEYKVLEKLLQVAGEVKITLCLEPKGSSQKPNETELFYPTKETLFKVESLARRLGVTVREPVVLAAAVPYRFREAEELAYLEKYFFQRPAAPYRGQTSRIKLVAAANRRAEVEGVAREITRLSREQGLRWREIAVILRDLEPYEQLIATVFTDHGIPFFIDRKKTVLHHPLVELIRSALEVIETNWNYEPVFRYLKTDLVPLSREKVDLLENYCLAHGLRGKSWTDGKPWSYRRQYTVGEETELTPWEEQELALINEARTVAAGDLLVLSQKLKEAKNVREMATALFELLASLNVQAKLNAWSKAAQQQGRLEEAREHVQVWNEILNLLDQIVEALGEEELSLEYFSKVLETGLESLRLGLIPPALDQVLVNNLEHSRNPNVKAAFVLGINDGVFPQRAKEEGLFSEVERENLKRYGLELAPGSRRRLFDEQFLIYLALTRASRYLWLSYPLADEEGRALMPSVVIARVKELLPHLPEKICTVEPTVSGEDEEEFISHPGRTLSFLAARLREAKAGRELSPLWWEVYNYFVDDPLCAAKSRWVLQSLFHRNNEGNISGTVSRALYGKRFRSSVSRLEKYASCPFAHFLSYGLRLQERSIYRLAAPDLGQFFHAALKIFVERLEAQNLEWGVLSRQECSRLTSEVVKELAPKLQNEILLSTARYRYLTRKLQQTVERAALVLTEHARRGSFRPVGLELGFGTGEKLPPLLFDLGNGLTMELTGRIDRVDLARCATGNYFRIIDYKSNFSRLTLEDIYHGLKLQLLAYLDVILNHAELLTGEPGKPAGILYFSVKDPLIPSGGPMPLEQLEKEIYKKLKMQGYVLADAEVVKEMDRAISGHSELIPAALKNDGTFHANSRVLTPEQFELLRKHLRETLQLVGREIMAGKVKIEPYRKGNNTSCQYCNFKPVCQFDLLLEDNVYRLLSEDCKEEIWLKFALKGVEAVE